MNKIVRASAFLLLAISLSGCFYGPRYHHRHWYGPYGGHPGYWR